MKRLSGPSWPPSICKCPQLKRAWSTYLWFLVHCVHKPTSPALTCPVPMHRYDPLTLFAAHPVTLQKFFEPSVKVVNGVRHLVVGVSSEKHGVKNAEVRGLHKTKCLSWRFLLAVHAVHISVLHPLHSHHLGHRPNFNRPSGLS